MGHIVTGEDLESKQDFLLAMVGHFEPSAWRDAAHHALSGAVRIGPFTEWAELEAFLQRRGPETSAGSQISSHWQQARAEAATMAELLADQRYQETIARAARVRSLLSEAYVLAHKPRDGEFRAVWNHSGTGDLADWDEAMRALSQAGFNAVVPNMWWGGVAHYASDLLPRSATFEEKGDQIAQAVEAGKRYGVEVHPWKVNFRLGRTTPEFTQQMREAGRLQMQVDGEVTQWLCPSHPDNQRLEIDTMVEVARNYDVDGVHFDYIRYPGEESCYCDGCRARFEAHLGQTVPDWPEDCHRGPLSQQYRDWRCEQINAVVRGTAEQVRAIKPHVKISAAVFSGYPGTKRSIGQDWLLWCREGWLDFVCPMNYTTSDSGFRSMVESQMGHLQGAVPLVTGIGHWRISDEQAIGQVEISRSLGSDGFILFNMGAALAERGLPKFGRAVTSAAAVLPHNAPVIRFRSPADDDQPVVIVTAESMTLEASLVSLGAHRRQATGVRGTLQVEDLAGEAQAALVDLPEPGGSVTVTIPRRGGTFRVSAVGELSFADGTAGSSSCGAGRTGLPSKGSGVGPASRAGPNEDTDAHWKTSPARLAGPTESINAPFGVFHWPKRPVFLVRFWRCDECRRASCDAEGSFPQGVSEDGNEPTREVLRATARAARYSVETAWTKARQRKPDVVAQAIRPPPERIDRRLHVYSGSPRRAPSTADPRR
jgi:uncharacterized lipoprotein YddW (UPF0748 family)